MKSVVLIQLDDLFEEIAELSGDFDEFTETWDSQLQDTISQTLFRPFYNLLEPLIGAVVNALTTTPRVHPNPAVSEIHSQLLLIAFILATLVFAAAGILYITGPILGISYREARQILPRAFLGLALATVAPQLFQLTVDLSDALIHALEPGDLGLNVKTMAGIEASIVLAWLVNSFLLLGVAAVLIIRMVYIMFVTAISPLIALAWSIPRLRKYADTFLGGYVAALLIAPLDLIVLKFSFALLQGNGTTALQSVSNWVLGVASFTLLLIIPYQVWGASQMLVGKARQTTSTLITRARQTRQTQGYNLSQDEARRLESYRRRRDQQ